MPEAACDPKRPFEITCLHRVLFFIHAHEPKVGGELKGGRLQNSALAPSFRYRALLLGTLLLTLFTGFLPADVDADLLILGAAGFLYGFVLVVSLECRTTITRAIVGVLILGLANYPGLLYLLIALQQITGKSNVILVFPGLVGAAFTVVVLKWLWTVPISFPRAIVLIVSVFPAGFYWYWFNVSDHGDLAAPHEWLVAIVEILWWWGFTLALVLSDQFARISRTREVPTPSKPDGNAA